MFNLTKKNNGTMRLWQNEMKDFVDKFNQDFNISNSPKIEVIEKEKVYTVSVEVPGMTEKDLNVSLKDNCLIVDGERKTGTNKEEKGQHFSEFSYGSFYRSVQLDEEIDPNKVKATYRDGILSVDLTKIENGSRKTKKIPITLN